jgi:hypothetical protein
MKTAAPDAAKDTKSPTTASRGPLARPKSGRLAQLATMMNQNSGAHTQHKLRDEIQNSKRVQGQLALAAEINHAQPSVVQPRFVEDEPVQREAAPTPNRTGLPGQVKAGVESLSGLSLDNVKLHYNSAKPAQLNALAYAQGADIHVAPGQEKHLPHEAWRIVQQKQGIIKPTMSIQKGIPIQEPGAAHFWGSRGNPVQRIVDVDGEQDPAKIWSKVRHLVEKVYRRKKTLYEWSALGPPVKEYKGYQELAEDLDRANESKASKGRVRPAWAKVILEHFDKTWGGKRHRRHIIMSSLMRDAVYSATDNNKESASAEVLAVFNIVLKGAGYRAVKDLPEAEARVVYALHNNPANLVLDSGAENSAIGALAHNVDTYLNKSDEELASAFKDCTENPGKFLLSLARGFKVEIQQNILKVVSTFEKPQNVAQFREFLEMLYDNTALDVMTKQKLPKYADEVLALHGRFVAARDSGDLQQFLGVAMTFVAIGNAYAGPIYSKIW